MHLKACRSIFVLCKNATQQDVFKAMPIHILMDICGTLDDGNPGAEQAKVVKGKNGQLFRVRNLAVRAGHRRRISFSACTTTRLFCVGN